MDPFALWFSILEEVGAGSSRFRLGRAVDGAATKWLDFHHKDCDGVGAFLGVLAEHEGHRATAPRIRPGERATALARFGALAKWARAPKPPAIPFKRFDRAAVGAPRALASKVLSREETARVLAKNPAGSVNSRLLWALDQAVTADVAHPMERHVWSLPVNMRGAVRDDLPNQSSFVVVKFPAGGTPLDVQAAVREGFERLDHWIAWDLMQVLVKLGPRAMRRFAEGWFANPPHEKLGVFSNLGVWGADRAPSPAAWLIDPPVSIRAPISATCMTWAGRMSLNLQTHPAISVEPTETARWIGRWKDCLLGRDTRVSQAAPRTEP
jgi:hypothetical protein